MKCNMCIRSIVCLLFLCLPAAHAASRKASVVTQPLVAKTAEAYGRLPLTFEANQGQSDSQVKFLSRGSGYSLFLTGNEAVLALKKPEKKTAPGSHIEPASLITRKPKPQSEAVLRMRLLGANANAPVTGVEELPGKSNYFIGNDRTKWRTDVPNYAKVKYANVYPGIDLVYYGNHRQLEFDLVVQPGADPKTIGMDFRGVVNGKQASLRVDKKGDLVVGSDGAEVLFHKPVVYQTATSYETAAAQRELIDGKFILTGAHAVRFQIAAYDRSRPLVIDPTLAYSTYLGGSNPDVGLGIAVDGSGNAYVTGNTYSINFPTTPGAFQTTFGGGNPFGFGDAFVSKLNAAGSALLYSTYLGGSDADSGFGIAVDTDGNAYVTGTTQSTNFPTTPGAFQTTLRGVPNVFVTKLNAAGSGLLYSTYLGGSSNDIVTGIALDAADNAYVTGATFSFDFPVTRGAFKTTRDRDSADAFVSKLNAAGTRLVYSTYLGGGGFDEGFGIAVDARNNAYVTGSTDSSNFPVTPGAFETTFRGGLFGDAFVTKLNAAGSGLIYSTYMGGSGDDIGYAIAVDASDHAYVTGSTSSINFPVTPGAFQTTFGGGSGILGGDGFVSKLNVAGSALLYSTYLGGSGDDFCLGIALDASGDAYVTGETTSSKFPTTPGAFQTKFGGGFDDAFVSKLNAAGSALLYSTYLGGSGDDLGHGLATDASNNVYVVGETFSTDFPITRGAFQATYGGGDTDAFVSKFAFGIPVCSLRTKLELDVDGDRDDGFELDARFASGKGGNIHPHTQPVTLAIGSYAVTIPAGSLVKRDEGYEFAGVINGVRLAVLIRSRDREEGDRGDDEENRGDEKGNRCTTGMYTVHATGKGARLKGTANPVPVTISIGENTGTTKVHAEFER